MREINDILIFREDISPFLVHLTRDADGKNAKDILKSIINERRLTCGKTEISDARFGMYTANLSDETKYKLFRAICFTETPLNEVHCLLDIEYRIINLSPYGLVFLKDNMIQKGVNPVLYLNNELADKDIIFQALCSLFLSHHESAEQILPLLAVFGQKIKAIGSSTRSAGKIDFRWEREWRYPFIKGPISFTDKNVFIGLCPDEETSEFETLFPGVGFIDPKGNMKWYATKLVQARKRHDVKFSVI